MLHTGYSRDFEREADQSAYALLRATGRSPRCWARPSASSSARTSTRGSCKPESEGSGEKPANRPRSSLPGYASTHPPTEERIRAAEEAAR
jgi:Zn-dependent protease with chaperone function